MAIISSVILACGFLLGPGAARGAEIEVDLPRGGWRDSSGEKLKFVQAVNYPASGVNTQAGQSMAAIV